MAFSSSFNNADANTQKLDANPPEPPVDLPANVTAIKPQKRSGRFNIFADDAFLIGVSEEVLQQLSIQKGSTITHDLFRKLYQKEYRSKLYHYLMKLLARREYSRAELYRKAMEKGYDKRLINNLLDEFQGKEYLSDERYARAFVKDKFSINRWGPVKIKSHLMKKGIDKELAGNIIAGLISEDEMLTACTTLLSKKQAQFDREEDSYKRKQKMLRYLASRGFPSSVCFKAVESCLNE